MNVIGWLGVGLLVLGGAACCKKPASREDRAPPAPGVVGKKPSRTEATFPPSPLFLPIPAQPRTLRVRAKGGLAMDVTTPPSTLSDEHVEERGEGYRLFGINNHEGVGGWAVAGIQGAGEYPLAGEGGKVIVDIELNAAGEHVGQHKVLRDGVLRVEQFAITGGKARFRATAHGKVRTDSGKEVEVAVAFHLLLDAPP